MIETFAKSFTKTGWQIYEELESVYPKEFEVLKLKKYVEVGGLVVELQKRRQEIDAERNEYKIGTRTRESLIGKIIMINEVLGLIDEC